MSITGQLVLYFKTPVSVILRNTLKGSNWRYLYKIIVQASLRSRVLGTGAPQRAVPPPASCLAGLSLPKSLRVLTGTGGCLFRKCVQELRRRRMKLGTGGSLSVLKIM